MLSSNVSKIVWALLLCSVCFTKAQFQDTPPYGPSQFSNIGNVDGLTVDHPRDLLSGGTITVDGITMIIPNNTYVTLPSIAVLWSELFVFGVPQLPQYKTPGVSWEATVFGNRVGDSYIVALVYLTQSTPRILNAFINKINLTTGEFWVGGDSNIPGTGIRARINDPIGRYGLAYTAHPLWAADTESPSITAASGYPMCIPRYDNGTDDPLCPLKNRIINGVQQSIIQFGPAATRLATDPDPNITAPLLVGDYVTLTGIEVGNGLLAVYLLVANLGLYTASQEPPTYIRVERAQVGVPGPANAEIGETRAVAYTTDETTPMMFYAIDVHPCTGVQTERDLQLTQPFSNTVPVGQVRGRALFRLGQLVLKPTRNVGFKMLTPSKVTANGIVAGIYIQPVFEFIIPELLQFGDEMFPVDFSVLDYLSQGSGPFLEGNQLAAPRPMVPLIGQLNPWPLASTTPSATNCPVASATPSPATLLLKTTITTITDSSTDITLLSKRARRQSRRDASPAISGREIDVIINLVVTQENGKGVTIVTITASSSVTEAPFPELTATGTGVNPLGPAPMTSLGNGDYILTVSVKHGLDSVTVQSSFGGSITVVF